MTSSVRHPATYSAQIIECMAKSIDAHTRVPRGHACRSVLDPFAGVGRVHELRNMLRDTGTWGIEIEPEWAMQAPENLVDVWPPRLTIIDDSIAAMRRMIEQSITFDAVATSPCYGNRFADKHTATDKCSKCNGVGVWRGEEIRRDGAKTDDVPCDKCKGSGLSPRRSYRHDLGRMPSDESSATMQWGDEYRAFHAEAWQLVHGVLRRRGLFLLNIKDHVRGGKLQRVPQWHRRTAIAAGFEIDHTWTISQNGLRHGANHAARASNELVYVFRRR